MWMKLQLRKEAFRVGAADADSTGLQKRNCRAAAGGVLRIRHLHTRDILASFHCYGDGEIGSSFHPAFAAASTSAAAADMADNPIVLALRIHAPFHGGASFLHRRDASSAVVAVRTNDRCCWSWSQLLFL